MAVSRASGRPVRSWLGPIFVLLIVVAIPFSALNQPGGPSSEAEGIIASWRSVPTDSGRARVVATIRMADGSHVEAAVVSGVNPPTGNVARLRVLRRLISGTKVYEIIETRPPS